MDGCPVNGRRGHVHNPSEPGAVVRGQSSSRGHQRRTAKADALSRHHTLQWKLNEVLVLTHWPLEDVAVIMKV